MFYLALLMAGLTINQPLETELKQIVGEYLLQFDLAPIQYEVILSDLGQVPEGAAVMNLIDESGERIVTFLFDQEFFLQLSERERRVIIAHEVSHLVLECRLSKKRINREICADKTSLRLVSVDDVIAFLIRSIAMFPYDLAQKEFVYRIAVIQESKTVFLESDTDGHRHSYLLDLCA